ncbi:MAG: multiple sugar transport system substrate-binding protein [Nitriliruptoraceae bacterium]|jgi:multiple sugar transport system substrate-binding protein
MKHTRIAAALAVVALVAGACTAQDDGRTELTLLLFGGPDEVAGYEQMAAAFEDLNPDLALTISPVAKQDDLLARLATSFAGGAPPELFLINFRKYGQFVQQGALAEVQPYLDASTVIAASDFVEPPLDAFRFDGRNLSCQPQNVSNLVAYVNLDLFQAAGIPVPYDGWTWDEFVTATLAMTTDSTYGLGTEASIIRLAPFVWSAGGEVVDDTDAPTQLMLEDGPARAAYDFFLDLALVHGVTPPDAELQSEDHESRFLRGGLGIYLNSRKSTPTLRTIDSFEWDVVPLPVAPGGTAVTMLHSDAYCIAAGTGLEDQAWRVIEFAMSQRGQQILAESGRTVPSRIDVLDSPGFLDATLPPANSEAFADNARIARATPHVPSWARVESAVDDLLEAAFLGRIDRDDALTEMHELARALFAGG